MEGDVEQDGTDRAGDRMRRAWTTGEPIMGSPTTDEPTTGEPTTGEPTTGNRIGTRAVLNRLALPVAAVLALAGCGIIHRTVSGTGGGGPAPTTAAISVAVGVPGDLVPSDTVDQAGLQILDALFTPLVTIRGGQPVPTAAASITSRDRKVWQITLRRGYTFADGQPVTAASYIKAWNFAAYGPHNQRCAALFNRIHGFDDLQAPAGKGRPRATTLAGLKQTGALGLQVTLDKPFADFPALLAAHAFDPLPDSALTATGDLAPGWADDPVGDGPFQTAGPRTATGLLVAREPGYPGTAPRLSQIDFRIYNDMGGAYRDLLAGKLDVLPQVPSADLGVATVTLAPQLSRAPSPYLEYLTVPNWSPALANTVLRRAISMAIDRAAITRTVFLGTYQPATSWVPPGIAATADGTCADACRYDPTAARRLYASSGGLPGNTLQIFYNSQGGHGPWVDAVCAQLHTNLGITCTGAGMPLTQLLAQAQAQKLPGLIQGAWSLDYPSARDYLAPLYQTGAANNLSGYHSDRFDLSLAVADASANITSAEAGYLSAERVLAADLPSIPLWYQQVVSARSTRMASPVIDPYGNVDVTTLRTR